MKSRIFSLFVALAIILSCLTMLSACSKQNDAVTITCTMFDAESVGKDAMWEYLEDKFNVNVEFVPITDDDFEEKTNLLIATNQMPDLMWLDLDESNFSIYFNSL